ncbi:MAG: hypothetical protein HFG38_09920 [Eubacterium sp.]|nr:hypothetical protein [Eubacterium sp.]
MSISKNLLLALEEDDNDSDCFKDCNDDHDFGKVLEYYKEDFDEELEVMCSDGIKRNLLYENLKGE